MGRHGEPAAGARLESERGEARADRASSIPVQEVKHPRGHLLLRDPEHQTAGAKRIALGGAPSRDETDELFRVQHGREAVGVPRHPAPVVQKAEVSPKRVGQKRVPAHRLGQEALVEARENDDRRVIQRQLEPIQQLHGIPVRIGRDRLCPEFPEQDSKGTAPRALFVQRCRQTCERRRHGLDRGQCVQESPIGRPAPVQFRSSVRLQEEVHHLGHPLRQWFARTEEAT